MIKLNNLIIVIIVASLSSCASYRPANPDDICTIFDQKSSWYRAANKAAKKWNGNLHVPMAIMYHESAFDKNAQPPMRYFLWVIPRGRASSAYGYPQALESTWAAYQRDAGSILSRRNSFADSIDFIQWYMHQTTTKNGVAKTDAYAQYLNYHEGQAGYARGSYKKKQWLINTAKRVERRANQYAKQLAQCSAKLG